MNTLQNAATIVGSQAAIASLLGVTPGAVNQWITGNRPFPVEHCPKVEEATHGAITCETLRDDVAWVRIPDKTWPHPKGRPLVDHSAKKVA